MARMCGQGPMKANKWLTLVHFVLFLGSALFLHACTVQAQVASQPQLTPDQSAALARIRDDLRARGRVDAASVGSRLARDIGAAFRAAELALNSISATLDNTHLVVVAQMRVWGADVKATLTFFFPSESSTEVQLQIQFDSSFDPAAIYRTVFPDDSAGSSLLAALRASSQVRVVFSTFDYESSQAGLSMLYYSVVASPTSEIAKAINTLSENDMESTFRASLFVPLFSTNPTYIDLELSQQGVIQLTESIKISSYKLSVSVRAATSFSLSADLSVSVKNQREPVTLSVDGQWSAASSSTRFAGQLTGSWERPFGADWISINKAKVSFEVSNQKLSNELTIEGTALFPFAPKSQSDFLASLSGSGDYIVSLDIAITDGISDVYSAVTHSKTPELLSGALVSGKISGTLASYTTSTAQKGLLLEAENVQIAVESTLGKAVRSLASAPLTFSFSLFLPVYRYSPTECCVSSLANTTVTVYSFSDNTQSPQLSLSASGSFDLTQSIKISSYTLSATLNARSSVIISASASISLAQQPQPLVFAISANWQETAMVEFKGSLEGKWQKPFDLPWLSFVSSLSLSIMVSSSAQARAAHVTISGVGSLTSTPNAPFSFQIGVRESGDWLLTVAAFPLNNLNSFYSLVMGTSLPELANVISLQGQADLSIATYHTDSIEKGLSIKADATVASNSELSQAIQTIQKSASSQTQYELVLFAPIFDTQGSTTIALSATGTIPLSSQLVVESFAVRVAISSERSSAINLDAQLAVHVSNQDDSISVDVTGQWNDQSSTVAFAGKIKSWTHPIGLNWLSFEDITAHLVLSSNAAPQFSLSGSASLSFSSSQAKASISYDDGQVIVSVTDIPITSISSLYRDVVGQTPPQYVSALDIKSTVSITIATASSDSVRRGFALTAKANVVSGSVLSSAAQTLIASPLSIAFDLDLFVPIFDTNPSAISFTLSASGTIPLTSTLHLQSFLLQLAATPEQETTISLGAQLQVNLAQQPQPVAFDISGKWKESGVVEFSGKLNGAWDNPFGSKWLSITDAALQLVVQQATVESLSLSGSAIIKFGSTAADTSFAITTANNFKDSTFVTQSKTSWSLMQIAEGIIGKPVSILDDVNQNNNVDLIFILSTYAHDDVRIGLTVQTKGKLVGGLLSKLKTLNLNKTSAEFTIDVNVPLFTSAPLDLALTVELDSEVQLTDHFYYEKLKLEIDAFPLAIEADSEFKATFSKNPDLLFDVSGRFSTDGSVILTGEMIGEWKDVFGIKGFILSDVILRLGFNPVMCAVGCISDVGLGFNMRFGTKTIIFAGNAAAPNFIDIFCMGSVSGSQGLAITVLDVVLEWNSMFPSLPIPTDDALTTWGLKDTQFSLAPKDGTFGGIGYQKGFTLAGGLKILDMDLGVKIRCSEFVSGFCDFAIDVHLDFHLFGQKMKQQVDILNEYRSKQGRELIFFTLDEVSLTQWSAHNLSKGIRPRWRIGLTVLNKKHFLDFEVDPWSLASPFSKFFHRWLSMIFS